MVFFCYIYSVGSDVPHMEALAAGSLREAEEGCLRMLMEHGSATRAELFDTEQRVGVVWRDDVTPPAGHR